MPEEFVPTPHDHLVKHIFGLPEVTAGLFEAYLDPVLLEGVDLSALRQKPGSFVDPELRASHTDLLFTAPWRDGETLFHLLLEHSTKVERFAALNLARYQVEILRDHLRSRQPEAPGLPPVISVVLHQGGPWTAPRRLSELVDGIEEGTARGEALRSHLLDLRYHVIELPDRDLRQIRGHIIGRVTLGVMQAAWQNRVFEFFQEYGDLIDELLSQRDALGILRTLLYYAANVDETVTPQSLRRMAQSISNQQVRENVMTLADKLREEGKAEGRVEGREEGLTQGRVSTLLLLLTNRFGSEAESFRGRISELPTPALDELTLQVLILRDLEELKTWLASR